MYATAMRLEEFETDYSFFSVSVGRHIPGDEDVILSGGINQIADHSKTGTLYAHRDFEGTGAGILSFVDFAFSENMSIGDLEHQLREIIESPVHEYGERSGIKYRLHNGMSQSVMDKVGWYRDMENGRQHYYEIRGLVEMLIPAIRISFEMIKENPKAGLTKSHIDF